MRPEHLAVFVFTLLGMLPLADSLSSIYTSLNGAACTDPQGFDKCISGLHHNYETCISGIGNEAAQEGCQSSLTCSYHNCWLSNCRNELNGCAYQYYAFQARDRCGVMNIEGFPALAGAPGGCSCPIGQVLEHQRYYFNKMDECFNFADKESTIDCLCCYKAKDDDLIDVVDSVKFALDINFPGWQCRNDYRQCQTLYGMESPPTGKYLNVNSHLPSGTLSPTIIATTTKTKSTAKPTTAKHTTAKPTTAKTSTHKSSTTQATSAHHSSKTSKAGTTHSITKTTKATPTCHCAKTTKA
ncbi:uncharacterized protein V1513DRAFT_460593 [Lipomyces chichibuensis]|uniref:uncharacterized protein n=1 Tax=Lipomyces chichibuensis TaxID=1546026 RepID=UPI0033435F7E